MARYLTLPHSVEAVRFNPLNEHCIELPDRVVVLEQKQHADNYAYMGFTFGFVTADGAVVIQPGDWIVTRTIDGVSTQFKMSHEDFLEQYELEGDAS